MQTYGGHTITGLRQWARDLGVKGRTRMTGDELLAACKAGARANVVAAERAVTDVVTVQPGTILRHKSTGAIVRATSSPHEYVRDGVGYQSLSFTAEYIDAGRPQPGEVSNRVDYLNRWQERNAENGYTIEHMLYQYEAVTGRDLITVVRQHPEIAEGTLGGVEMAAAVVAAIVEQDHAEAMGVAVGDLGHDGTPVVAVMPGGPITRAELDAELARTEAAAGAMPPAVLPPMWVIGVNADVSMFA